MYSCARLQQGCLCTVVPDCNSAVYVQLCPIATVLFIYSVLYLCPVANQFEFSGQVFVESPNIKLQVNPSEWDPCWYMRTDSQTALTKLSAASNCSNGPEAVYEGNLLVDYMNIGHGSSVGIATDYGLDGPGIESRWVPDFPHLSRPALGPTQPPVQWVPGLSRG